ncbi:MAG: ABC transporter permease [Caldilineaceae bacterium]
MAVSSSAVTPINTANTKKAESQAMVVLRRFLRHRMAVISAFIIILILIASILAPAIAPFERDAIDISSNVRPAPPGVMDSAGNTHWLGIDHLGRDLFTRVLYAGRISLIIAIFVTFLSETIGVIIGALAGYYGGWVDLIVSRIIEFMLSLPLLPILLIFSAILLRGGSEMAVPPWAELIISKVLAIPARESKQIFFLIFILVIFGWLGSARLMRGMVLSLRSQDFVESLRALGASDLRIIFGHLITNGLAPILVNASLNLGGVIITEAALSFLGLGIQDPTPTWGNMLSQSQTYMFDNPWMPLVPGVPLVLVSLCINFIGDGLRDALDPRLKR